MIDLITVVLNFVSYLFTVSPFNYIAAVWLVCAVVGIIFYILNGRR